MEEEKRLERERKDREKLNLNLTSENEKPKKKKIKKGDDAIDDIVTLFMEENNLKIPFDRMAEGK